MFWCLIKERKGMEDSEGDVLIDWWNIKYRRSSRFWSLDFRAGADWMRNNEFRSVSYIAKKWVTCRLNENYWVLIGFLYSKKMSNMQIEWDLMNEDRSLDQFPFVFFPSFNVNHLDSKRKVQYYLIREPLSL